MVANLTCMNTVEHAQQFFLLSCIRTIRSNLSSASHKEIVNSMAFAMSVTIHMGCLMVQCEKKTSSRRGNPTYVPPSVFPQPQHFGGYAYGIPYWNPNSSSFCPSPSNMHHYNAPQPQHQSSGKIGQMMFGLVKTLGVGVISNMIFGVDVSPLFSV
ncbi:hypothetical protein A4A49_33690 [Nicotiana attenuata]|uniref:Uncharacterized protein n=1 Tax=Nicotiana attenuata TaxID=49451 RepID=A0A1J6KNZ5_NICAT|nr:hypothetical protein A4A49_33690 [Nicotiana attenuata]